MPKHTRAIVLTIVALGLAASMTEGQSARSQTRPVLIKGGTVITVTQGTINNGSVLLRDGRIEAVGRDIPEPPDAEIVDATGLFVTPGIIDAHTHIAADSINESGTTVSSMTGIEDVLDPTDINIYRDLAGGVTTANVLHGSANPIGGKNAVIKLRWGKQRPQELIFEGAPPGIKFALGENPIGQNSSRQPRRYPATRLGVEFVIRDAFTRAKTYQQTWLDYERRRAAGEDVVAPRRDLQLEPLVEVLEGTRLVHAHCYRADEILMLIRLAEELGFKIATFQHVLEGYKVADEIAAHGAGGSTFIDMWGFKQEAIDAIPYNAALMARRGVLVSLNSDSAERARRLNTNAAMAIKWGDLTNDEALALITINAATQLAVDDRVGSLEAGKDADVAIWTAHPLSSYAVVERTYVDGIPYYDRETDQNRPRPRPSSDGSGGAAGGGSTTNGNGDGFNGDGLSANGSGRYSAGNGNGGGQSAGGAIALTNAEIHPVTAERIDRGTVVIRNGLIEAVGVDVTVPNGAEVIDVGGAQIYPGWIDARTTLGLQEPGARGYSDASEMLDFSPQVQALVSFHPDNVGIPIARTNGVTTVAATPAGGLLGGQTTVMNLDGWTWEEAGGGRAAVRGNDVPVPDRSAAGDR